MARALIFNPENDLALAAGIAAYTPPPAAVQLHNSGALLPFWWARHDDVVIIPPHLDEAASRLKERFALSGIPSTRCHPGSITEAEPWGWSPHTLRQLTRAGISPAALPDDDAIAAIRLLSHRRTTIQVLRELGEQNLPAEFSDAAAAMRQIAARSGQVFIKMPWSSSGRGVFRATGLRESDLSRRIEAIIRRQGSVMVEPAYDKIRDFATLYYSDGTAVSYRSPSIFVTDPHGAYTGNRLGSPTELEAMLDFDLRPLASRIARILTPLIAPRYRGWLGVDMLQYRTTSGSVAVAPCIEVNLRMTMGVLAHYVSRHLSGTMHVAHGCVPPGATDIGGAGGEFSIYVTES